jgi:signal peptidase I
MIARSSMPTRPKLRGSMLRTGAIATVTAAVLHLGLTAGSSPARADIFPAGLRKFSIPSTSMTPTLLINEYIFTVEWPRVSRGDLVVYLLPKDNSTVYIKRVIVRQYRETLPGGRSHRILEMSDNGFLDNTQEYVVPAGHYFMIGDNRDNSSDSRSLARHGYVPAGNIVGRPELVYFSMAEGESAWKFWRWPWSVRWSRLFTRLG